MSVFLLWWTLGSSLCSAIAAIIATGSLATRSLKFIPITVVIYWILLGIVEWKLLSPHISRAYQWGLLTIVGGIVGSCLLAFAFQLILFFLLKDFSPIGLGGSHPNLQDLLVALFVSIICLFTTGFLLGFGQNLIDFLQKSCLANSVHQMNSIQQAVAQSTRRKTLSL